MPAPTGIERSWVELAPQWPGDASLPDERSGPAAPLVGSLYVNSTEDIVSSNSQLTLRDAILVANGVLITLAEQAQMSGCTLLPATAAQGSLTISSLHLRWDSGQSSRCAPRCRQSTIHEPPASLAHNVQPVINAQNLTTG